MTSLEERLEQLESEVKTLKHIIKYSSISYFECETCEKILNPNIECKGCNKTICKKCMPFYYDNDFSGYCRVNCAIKNWQSVYVSNTGDYPRKDYVTKINELLERKALYEQRGY